MKSIQLPAEIREPIRVLGFIVFFGFLILAIFMFVIYFETTATGSIQQIMESIFALNSSQTWWYITRAAGLTGYFLMWLSMVWGFVVSSHLFSKIFHGVYSYDFHEHLSLLGLGFVALHVIVLLVDQFLPFTPLQILVPFIDSYRPLWVGMGVVSMYLFLLVTVTFYLRKVIGSSAFRSIHVLSILGYMGTTLHGFFAGTDSALAVTKILYAGSFLVMLFLTMYWFVLTAMTQHEQAVNERNAALKASLIRNGGVRKTISRPGNANQPR